MARSVGLKRDVRVDLFDTYANYYYLNFKNFIGSNGDCYDRFLIRMNEMTESLNIITQIISKMFISNHKNKTKTSNSVPTVISQNKFTDENFMHILNFNFDPELDVKYHYVEKSKIIRNKFLNKNLPLNNMGNRQINKIHLNMNQFNMTNILKLNSHKLINKLNKKTLNTTKYNSEFKFMENIINHFKY
jgi:hypothetical protein